MALPQPHWKLRQSSEEDQANALTFENQLDHFNPKDERTYSQRYWYDNKFFGGKENNAPVFLYICVSLEHRYYGKSQPFDDWSTDNLEYLTSEQALADIATFIEGTNKSLGYEADWIVVGGSYPGALSAWFKSQYPDHAIGAWSSSGVINAVRDFKSFDLDIFMRTDQSGPDCSNAVKESIDIVTEKFKTKEGTQEIADLFKIDVPIDQRDFWFYFGDISVMGVQYGSRVSMCETLVSAAGSQDTLIQAVADLAVHYGITYSQYAASYLKDTTIDVNDAGRQWTWQYCNEFGFFQTPNIEQPMRSQALDLDFWPDYCERIFGRKIENRSEQTNKLYGGLDIRGDNIAFVNGSEDPWQFAAMRQLRHTDTTQRTMSVQYVQCDTCAHCVDFATPTPDMNENLRNAQNAVADQVADWLKQAQAKREASLDTVIENEPNWSDIDFEQKRLDLNEVILPGNDDDTVVFLQ